MRGGRLLFLPRGGDAWEPVTAIRLALEEARGWVLVLIRRSGPEHPTCWVLPSQLHLEDADFFGFVDFLRTVPGWRDDFERRMLGGIAAARRRRERGGWEAHAMRSRFDTAGVVGKPESGRR